MACVETCAGVDRGATLGEIALALLSAFNPHEFSETTVRTVATGREDTLAQIVTAVRGNISAASIQHLILSAPRGYGKSFMMRHVQFELARIAQDEQLPLRTVLMPEEMPHVREPESLLTELARAIEGGAGGDADLTWHEDEGELWEAATVRLETAMAAAVGNGGLVVALVENFDALIKRAFARDIQSTRLRELLTRRDSQLMLISASATGAFDRDYDKPLFQAFAEIKLEPWTIEQCLTFFARQRIAAGKPPLTPIAEARARAVSEFIGGTPRLATLLGDALLDDDVIGAAELLHRLVDELTPYYKERVEALPGRSQKLLDALLRFGEPASQTEIARRVSASGQNAIAGPFRDLIAERIIVGEKAPGSAERLFRVADRVFAHYYRRRVVQHGQNACPLEALVDLLAVYFSPDEKKEKIDSFAKAGRIDEARVMARLHLADVRTHEQRQHDLREKGFGRRRLADADAETRVVLEAVEHHLSNGNIAEAQRALDAALASALPDHGRVLLLLCQSDIDDYVGLEFGHAAAQQAADLATQINDVGLQCLTLQYLIFSCRMLDRHEEAITGAQRLTTLAEGAGDLWMQAYALRVVAWNLECAGYHDESSETAQRAADLAERAGDFLLQAWAMNSAVLSLGTLGRHDEAMQVTAKAMSAVTRSGDQTLEALWMATAEFLSTSAALDAVWSPSVLSPLMAIVSERFSGLGFAKSWSSAWLTSLINRVHEVVEDPQTLNDWASAIRFYFGDEGDAIAQRLRTSADYHASGRAPASLARVDPDLATTLRTMFPPE